MIINSISNPMQMLTVTTSTKTSTSTSNSSSVSHDDSFEQAITEAVNKRESEVKTENTTDKSDNEQASDDKAEVKTDDTDKTTDESAKQKNTGMSADQVALQNALLLAQSMVVTVENPETVTQIAKTDALAEVITAQNSADPTATQQGATLTTNSGATAVLTEQAAATNVPTTETTVQTTVQTEVKTAVEPTQVTQSVTNTEQQADTATANKNTDTAQDGAQAAPVETRPLNFDGEKLNIKVAEAPIDTTAPDFTEQIAQKISLSAQGGVQKLTVELSPKELGEMTVELSQNAGKIVVEIFCSDPKTQSLMMQNADNIRQMVERSTGLDTVVKAQEREGYYHDTNPEGRGDNSGKDALKEQAQKQNEARRELINISESASFIGRLRLGISEAAF